MDVCQFCRYIADDKLDESDLRDLFYGRSDTSGEEFQKAHPLDGLGPVVKCFFRQPPGALF